MASAATMKVGVAPSPSIADISVPSAPIDGVNIDTVSLYSKLRAFAADTTSNEPLRLTVNDPNTRHYIHTVALRMDLVSASQGTFPNRQVLIWKDKKADLDRLRDQIRSFASSSDKERVELAPQPAELRYAARLLARDYGLVGISEGLGASRHTVLWKTADRQQIDARLRAFASGVSTGSSTDMLQLPPLSGPLFTFAAMTAADLGLHIVHQGVGEDRNLVVYRTAPVSSHTTASQLRTLYDSIASSSGRVTAEDIRGALKQLGLPERCGATILDLAAHSPTGDIDFESFQRYVSSKERELRAVFCALDTKHQGVIPFSELQKAFRAMNLAPSSEDYQLLQAFISSVQNQNTAAGVGKEDGGLTYEQFRDFFTLVSPKDLTKLGEHCMSALSIGFQPKASAKVEHDLTWTVCSSTSGAIANALSRTVVAPFERVRLQMAVDPMKYKNMIDCMRTIYLQEGIKGLWRGNVLNVIRIAPQGAIAFLCKDVVKDALPDRLRYTSVGLAIASMLSGAICMTAVYPLDFVRGRMTTCPGVYKSWQDALRIIYKQGGMKALFEGVNHSNSWAAVYYGVQFFAYDSLKQIYSTTMRKFGREPSIDTSTGLLFGAISGSFCVSAAYPFESIRRKLQVQGFGGRPVKYDGWIDCFKKVVRTEGGYRGLFKGLGANMFKTPPSIAITFGAYEYLMKNVFLQRT